MEREDVEEEEFFEPINCPFCGTMCNLLGTLGRLTWYRCPHCGTEVHADRAVASKDRLLTTGEVARRCGVSLAAVKVWCKKGKIRSFRIGATGWHRRIPESAVTERLKTWRKPS